MRSTQPQPALDTGDTAPLPPIPFAAWALLVLAYPICYLAGLAVTPGVALTAVLDLPAILLHGLRCLPVIVFSGLLWAIAVGAGATLLRRVGFASLSTGERAVFGGAAGMGILSIATFLIGTVSGNPPWLMRALLSALLIAMAAFGGREAARMSAEGARALNAWRRGADRLSAAIVALAGLIVLFALTRANVPVFADYDALEYHLAGPAQWWQAGRVSFIGDNVYTNFPQGVEMLYLAAMTCLGGPDAGAAVGLQVGIGFVVLAAAGIALCGRRLHSAAAGGAGAAVFLTTPMLAELATLNSYVVELPLAAYSFLALFAFVLLWRAEAGRDQWRLAALCGALVGLAIGCKYPAVLFVLVPIEAFLAVGGILRLHQLKRAVAGVLIVGFAALLVASPWLIRNAVNTGNPTYPLLHETFGGSNWTPEQEALFSHAHRPPATTFLGLGVRFWRFALWRDQPSGGWTPPASPILFLFAIVPFVVADRRSSRALLYFAILFLVLGAFARFAPERLGDSHSVTDVIMAAGILGLVTAPAFLLAAGPLIFAALHAGFWLIAWYGLTHHLDRFLDPATPAVALLAGVGVASLGAGWPRRVARGLVACGLAHTLAVTFLLFAPLVWFGLGEPRDSFLRQLSAGSTYSARAIEAINRLTDPDAKTLFVGESRTFYCRRPVVASTVFDVNPIERIAARGPQGDPARRVRDGLRELGVTHVYVNWPEVARLASSYTFRYGGVERPGVPKDLYLRLVQLMTDRGYLRLVQAFGSDEADRHYAFFIYKVN